LLIWTGRHISVYVVLTNLDPLALILHFLNQYWIEARLVCSFCEAMAGTLSVASTAVLSAKVAVVYSGEVGRSVMNSRYNNGRRALLWGVPALAGESSAMQIGF
jgi:hypothetical protein